MALQNSASNLWDETWGQPTALRLDVQQALFRRSILVPSAEFVGEPGPPRIEWTGREQHQSPELDGCVFSFARLGEGALNDFRLFTSRWGPLGICKHGQPSTHSSGSCRPLNASDRFWERRTEPMPWLEWSGRYWEPMVAYRFYARRVAAAVKIAAALHLGQATRPTDWAQVIAIQDGTNMDVEFAADNWDATTGEMADAEQYSQSSCDMQRELLSRVVNQWLFDAGVYPSVSWGAEGAAFGLVLGRPLVPVQDRHSRYEWHGATLHGVLMAQLAAIVASGTDFTTCSWCGKDYVPERKPRADRRNFCSPECGDLAHKQTDAGYQRRKRRIASSTRFLGRG